MIKLLMSAHSNGKRGWEKTPLLELRLLGVTILRGQKSLESRQELRQQGNQEKDEGCDLHLNKINYNVNIVSIIILSMTGNPFHILKII